MGFKAAPLSNTFALVSILGFVLSFIWVYDLNPKFGFAFGTIFLLMGIASFISAEKAEPTDAALGTLAMHKRKK